ncbi:MAG: ABC transporter substrate-binding protein [Patescibacteria group bacterium]|nr:ABC transporter substrate-binding protein [Patescibacteria group bacterium]
MHFKNLSETQADYDKKLIYSLSKSRIPTWRQFKYINKYLSLTEKWIVYGAVLLIFLSVFYLSVSFYFNNLQIVPISGGVYTEGLIGSPKHINPLYASINDVDNDIAALVYSSLFKRGKNGELKKDLLENYSISEDNKEYTFYIRDNVYWHDGAKLNVDDILFTIAAIQDQQYKSLLRPSLVGVDTVRLDDYSFKLILSEPYVAFLEILTFGILPADLWAQVPSESAFLAELNIMPIGSGPYKFDSFSKNKNGIIQEYNLARNPDYYGQVPKVDISFVFFVDFIEAIAALNANSINGISYLPQDLKEQILTPKAYHYNELYLPQLTLIFFNQERNPALADKAVRQALIFGLNRGEIINNVLGSNAYIANGPILANNFAFNTNTEKYNFNRTKAEELLDSVDWKLVEINSANIATAEAELESSDEETKKEAKETLAMGEGQWRKKDNNFLVIEIKTVERNENELILGAIKGFWEELGVKTVIDIVPITRINNEVIKTREFDALFYGQVMGADPDPYAFWHSSQTGENGFNIANFVNKEADKLLEDARLIFDQGERQKKYFRFQEIIAEETPAIFMYSPIYTYIQSNNLKGFQVKNIFTPKDRFSNINDWYLKTGKKLVWD